jgi:hypothetical protein
MDIPTNMTKVNAGLSSQKIKTEFTEKISKEEVLEIKAQIAEQAKEMMLKSTATQNYIQKREQNDVFLKQYDEFQSFLQDIGYDGKPIAELSQDEAAELVAEDGFFGVAQTSERIAAFVINGAAGNEELLRAGREGMLQGFKEAEAMWGGELPEISQETMQASIEMVDKAMMDLGFSIIDKEV